MQRWTWLAVALFLPVTLIAPHPSAAQQQSPANPTPPAAATGQADEIQALIERMRKKVEDMGKAAAERDKALEFLEKQVEEATKVIGTSSQTTEALREKTSALNVKLEDIAKDRDKLSSQVSEREKLLAALEQRVAALTDLLGLQRPDRHRLGDSLEALRVKLDSTIKDRDDLAARLAKVEQERTALKQRQATLEQRIAGLEQESRKRQAEAEKRIASLGGEIRDREARLRELEQRLGTGQERIRAMNAEIARLNRQLATLKDLLGSLDEKLQEADVRNQRQQTRIADLTVRLNMALAKKVEELKNYRSEFFGRLKKALGDRPDIKVVGDRFVLQAELLFPSGSARLDPAGEAELVKVADTLKEVAATIPPDIDWVLRVDGHTDKVPVRPDSIYRSNWELSTARALTVVQFLIAHGVPPNRLVAAGFGEFQPIDPGNTEAAYRRNRRIEFKLTER